ncbi:MAG: redox-sensing transcriptional repressor Rex [Verrucomicrobiota bacterium]
MGRKKTDSGFTDIEHDPKCPRAVVVVQRLLKYHDFLHDLKQRNDSEYVCSSGLAEYACCESSLVRRDFSSIGIQGQARVGYSVKDALASLEAVLGCKGVPKAVLFGVGRLGTLLLRHDWRRQAGVDLVAAFDKNPDALSEPIGKIRLKPFSDAQAAIRKLGATIAILAVHSNAAQECADISISAGVRAIWNFAPCVLDVPAHVVMRNENLSSGLKELRCIMSCRTREKRPGR